MSLLIILSSSDQIAPLAWLGYHLSKNSTREISIVEIQKGKEKTPNLAPTEVDSLSTIQTDFLQTITQFIRKNPDTEHVDNIKFYTAKSKQKTTASLHAVEELEPDSVLIELSTVPTKNSTEITDNIAKTLYENSSPEIIIFRPSQNFDSTCNRVIVPCKEEHSNKESLRLANDIAQSLDCQNLALYAEPPYTEESEEVGNKILGKLIKESGVHTDHLTKEISLTDSLEEALKNIASKESDDLIITAAPHNSTIRKGLFNKLTNQLLENETGFISVRAKSPIRQKLKNTFESLISTKVPQIFRSEKVDLFERLETGSIWQFDYVLLICLSTAIAALGLIQNSTAVVIGAMLVAPLMTPLLGAGLSITQGNSPLLKNCVKTITLSFIFAILIGLTLGYSTKHFFAITPEITSRGYPNILDLLVAFFSGIAASYCVSRKNLASALAGVAIAAALIPPIASIGLAFAYGEYRISKGASLLFITNVVAIILGAALTFWMIGIRTSDRISKAGLWTRRILIPLFTLIALFLLPLGRQTITPLKLLKNEKTKLERYQSLLTKVSQQHTIESITKKENNIKLSIAGPHILKKEELNQYKTLLSKSPIDNQPIRIYQQVWHDINPKKITPKKTAKKEQKNTL